MLQEPTEPFPPFYHTFDWQVASLSSKTTDRRPV